MKQKSKKEYQDKDGLLKIVLRKCMKNTLRAAVPNAEDIFDLSQEIEPMDQELPLIWQGRKKQGKRIVDFVFKIPLKNRTQPMCIVNLEIQDYKDDDFADRMFTHFYRLWDRFRIPIVSIAIYTDDNEKFHPGNFKLDHPLTSMHFQFRPYKILDQTDDKLKVADGAFYFITRIIKLAHQKEKIPDENIIQKGLTLAREINNLNIDDEMRNELIGLLQHYINFTNKENINIFAQQLSTLTNKSDAMTVMEYVKEQAAKQAAKEAAKQAAKERQREKAAIIHNLLKIGILTDEQVANVVGVTVSFVNKVKKSLKLPAQQAAV